MKTIGRIRYALSLFLMAFVGTVSADKGIYTIGVQDFESFLPYSQYSNQAYDGLGKAILDLFAKKKWVRFYI